VQKISSLVTKLQNDHESGQTQISEFVSFSLKDNISKIEAYLNSKFTSNPDDYRPFFNIVTAVANIWMRATDIDRKNIRIKASKADEYLLAFLASIHLQEWMKKLNFGTFLNEWGRTLARYGSAVVKFVEKEGELHSEMVPWNRLICDAVDFENNPKIEKLYFTPAQLKMNPAYNQEVVDSLIEDSKTTRKSLGFGQQKDNKAEYIEVYELHGLIPLSYKTEDEDDEKTYKQLMFVLSMMGKGNDKKDYILYSGIEKQDPYMITHLIKEEGRSMAIGAVEHLFDAQWMVNHTAKLIKDQLELASKIIFQTSDPNFVGKNALTNIQNGEVLTYAQNQPLTQLNNKPDIVALQAYGQQWQTLAREITGTPEAMRGETMPSGTPYSLGALLTQQASSLFELMTENKGLHIEDMLIKYILPFIKKKMDTSEEIAATLEAHQIKQLDSAFVPKEAIKQSNQKIKDDILSGRIAEQPDMALIESQIQAKLNETGNQRFIKPSEINGKTWKQILTLKWIPEVEITGESTDKQAVLQTLSTVLQSIVSNPAILQDPNAKLIFNKILETTGSISALEIQQTQSQPMGQPVAPSSGQGSIPAGMNLQPVK